MKSAGTLAVGDRLPPRRDIARALGINVTTVTRALATLQQRGLLEARPGRGTTVAARQAGERPSFVSAPSDESGIIDLSVWPLRPISMRWRPHCCRACQQTRTMPRCRTTIRRKGRFGRARRSPTGSRRLPATATLAAWCWRPVHSTGSTACWARRQSRARWCWPTR
ncbi:winged helix-turn-helix domain-containing protein [Mesorhizobium sp. B2-3-5]|uniref:GntR family transcriptional regulator n=1 Tax=Mesorhizobium sp. B2-3-5 TaxID=2589958 RepID=UPI001FEDD3CA|nr:winged helix-turn-helix domain-containing protein [Mesorhizobium sp. B2-3-5]